ERSPADADCAAAGRDGREPVLDDSESGRRAAVLDVRLDHDPQRRVLQVRELREYQRLRLSRGAAVQGAECLGIVLSASDRWPRLGTLPRPSALCTYSVFSNSLTI